MPVVFAQSENPYRLDGVAWEAQLFLMHKDFIEIPYPLATAYISDFGHCQILDFILVPDHMRRRGYATKVIEACFRRWPDLQLTDGINEAGKALVAKFQKEEGAE